jgi:ABC-type dipeptide/oligopeptide/nickel transport system permease subunit
MASPGADAADGGARSRLRRYEASDLEHALLPPAWARADGGPGGAVHLLGTDRLGRDLFVRCLAGGGISLAIGFAAAAVAVLIGTAYGTISGYAGGACDAVMMRVLDILYGLPNILLVVLLAVAVEGIVARSVDEIAPGARQAINVCTLLAAIGGVTWLTMARVIRGQVLSLKQQPFMEACRATGVPLGRQVRRHLLPNLVGPIIVYATLAIPSAMLAESFLSFLGIGVREPLPSWGNLVAEGLGELNVVRSRWWLLLFPCLFIAVTLLALNFVGEALREAMDPKRR